MFRHASGDRGRRVVSATWVAILLAGACAEGDAPRETADPDASAAAVEAGLTDFFEAVEAWDFDALRAAVTPDFQLIEDTLVLDLPAFIDNIEPIRRQGAAIDYHLSDFNTEVEGPVAWTSYRVRAELTTDGERSEFEWLESAVLRRTDGAWRTDRMQSAPLRAR